MVASSRVEQVSREYNKAVDDKVLTKTAELTIGAILAVGAEINFLRIAVRTNSIDIEECINRIVDESVRVVMSSAK